jgi:hypothetical protein
MPDQPKFHPAEQAFAHERALLEGAQAALDELREDLILRRNEAREASAREAYDETLTLIDSRLLEYQRRRAEQRIPSAHHASYVFLLDVQGAFHPLPHRLYVELVRGEAVNPQLAGQTVRLAEWYVRMEHDTPETVVKETYGLLTFDAEGRVDWAATPSFHPHRDSAVLASESVSLPTPEERERMLDLLFGAA